uniref:Uncharacterized protein n=1 Tax=Schizaphis graminum TaxID=13262 RepID=A0A2S2PM73_SCHGA
MTLPIPPNTSFFEPCQIASTSTVLRPLKINTNENTDYNSTPADSSCTENNENENTANVDDYKGQATLTLNMDIINNDLSGNSNNDYLPLHSTITDSVFNNTPANLHTANEVAAKVVSNSLMADFCK